MLSNIQKQDLAKCESMQCKGQDMACLSCTCNVCIAEQPDRTAAKMEKWFIKQIEIAKKVGPIGVATLLTLNEGLKILKEE